MEKVYINPTRIDDLFKLITISCALELGSPSTNNFLGSYNNQWLIMSDLIELDYLQEAVCRLQRALCIRQLVCQMSVLLEQT